MRAAAVLAAGAVLTMVTYPLLDGGALRAATVLAVLLFCAASVTHATVTHGRRAGVALVVVAGGTGLVAESVGVATGVPFGEYDYAGTLGPQVLGVPVLVPVAWTMMAWPCLLAGRALSRRPLVAVALAAWALAAWDLFLDPQMVAAGHWAFSDPDPGLPGVPGIPLTNFAGWLLVAVVLQTLLHLAVPRRDAGPGSEAVPAALLGWTWLGSALANVAFFDRPAVAAWGFVAMGVVVGPYLAHVTLARSHREVGRTAEQVIRT